MRKKVLFIVMSILMLLPLSVNAASITGVSMSGGNHEQEVGNQFMVSFQASFSGVERNSTNTSGIYMVAYELVFDDSTLEITEVYADFYDSTVYKDEGKYYVISVADSDSTGNKCADNFLACTNYSSWVKFRVKKADQESTTIKLTEFAAGAFKVDVESEEYLVEDMEELEYTSNKTLTIKLKQSTEVAEESKNTIVQNTKPEITNDTIASSKSNSVNSSNSTQSSSSDSASNTDKSSNRSLKTLNIENYDLELKKDKYTYKLTLPADVNALKITAEPEDSKASYVITGADDLKKNKDKVKILVTAENGEKITYTINIERKEVSNEEEATTKIVGKLNSVVIIVIAAIILIIVIATIISYNNKKKLKRLLDEYNK